MQHDPMAVELDPGLLATPCQIQTRWHVITGAISCGKTTLIDLLAELGFRTVAEIPRQYLAREMAKGRTLEEIFASVDDERAIYEWQCRAEKELLPATTTFLDRALPDFLWFWRLHGLDPNEILPDCLCHRYASVFVLDPLPLDLDGARIDDEAFKSLFDECLVRDYTALGYDVVRVPPLFPQGRVEFVFETLSRQGLL